MVEYFGYIRIPKLYPEFVVVIFNNSQVEELEIWKICIYGIGAIAVNAGDYYSTVYERSVKILTQTIDCEQPYNVDINKWKIVREYAISSLGKILEHRTKILPNSKQFIKYWLNHLPLENDIEQVLIENERLTKLVLNHMDVMLGNDYENFETIMNLYLEMLETDQVNEKISEAIRKSINIFRQSIEINKKLICYESTLNPKMKKKLENCCNLPFYKD